VVGRREGLARPPGEEDPVEGWALIKNCAGVDGKGGEK